MKKRKHICFLNLVLFLGSFLLLSINGIASGVTDTQSTILHRNFVAKHLPSSNTTLQASEKNENENENDLEPVFKVLPFSFNYYYLTTEPVTTFIPHLLLFKSRAPIYLSVSNFRI